MVEPDRGEAIKWIDLIPRESDEYLMMRIEGHDDSNEQTLNDFIDMYKKSSRGVFDSLLRISFSSRVDDHKLIGFISHTA